MVVPQFLRFYAGYTMDSLMAEKAKTFFSLVNAMFRIKASESLEQAYVNSIPNMDKGQQSTAVAELRKGSEGIHGIIQEVKQIKGLIKK